MPRPWLVLFDIDGTLLLSGRAGVRGLRAAVVALYGRGEAVDGVPMAGRTDRAIVLDVLGRLAQPSPEGEIARVKEAYFRCLADEIRRPVDHFCGVLPGVGALLDDLEARDDAVVGLLTGNFERGAAIKLGHFDLHRRFGFGAFGDEHVERRALVPVALERARAVAAAHHFAPDRVIVIGDTPLDVDCAKHHGALAVGVATGGYDAAALAGVGADLVLGTLDERDRLFEWMEQQNFKL